jgi:inosose dehydratase
MAVRIAINPITWTNDDMPELGGDTPLETCLSEAAAAGYSGIEMGGKFPTTANALSAALASHGLTFVSGWYSGHLLSRSVADEVAAMAAHLDLLATMGCAVMVFAEGTGATHGDRSAPASRRTLVPPDEWPRYAAKLGELADRMVQKGVRMAFHHHMGTPVQTAEEVDRLMQETRDSVGLLLDTGHATYAGADPLALADAYAARVVHVHCKDVRNPLLRRALERDDSFLDAVIDGVFTMPGDGDIAFGPVLTRLARQGYAGWLVAEAEQDPAKAHPLTYARLGYANLVALAREAGFAVEP